MAMVPALLTICVVPFGSTHPITLPWGYTMKAPGVIADVGIGVLLVFALASLSVYGIVLAGWASNSKYPFLGGIRSSAQMISYEVSMGLSVIPLFLVFGELNLSRIVDFQAAHGWTVLPFLAPSWPWDNWKSYVLWLPMLVSFLIFLVSSFAETNRLPFDLPESETELVGGYHTEYSAMKFALFFLGEYAAMIVASCIMVTPLSRRLEFAHPILHGSARQRLEPARLPGRLPDQDVRLHRLFHLGPLDAAPLPLRPAHGPRLEMHPAHLARQHRPDLHSAGVDRVIQKAQAMKVLALLLFGWPFLACSVPTRRMARRQFPITPRPIRSGERP